MERILTRSTVVLFALALVLACRYTTRSAYSVSQKGTAQAELAADILFEKHCDTCHGKDGRAKTFKAKFNHARNLTDAKWQAETSDERLFNSISNGRRKMPAFGKKLSEAQINALVAYVRKLKK